MLVESQTKRLVGSMLVCFLHHFDLALLPQFRACRAGDGGVVDDREVGVLKLMLMLMLMLRLLF